MPNTPDNLRGEPGALYPNQSIEDQVALGLVDANDVPIYLAENKPLQPDVNLFSLYMRAIFGGPKKFEGLWGYEQDYDDDGDDLAV